MAQYLHHPTTMTPAESSSALTQPGSVVTWCAFASPPQCVTTTSIASFITQYGQAGDCTLMLVVSTARSINALALTFSHCVHSWH